MCIRLTDRQTPSSTERISCFYSSFTSWNGYHSNP